MRGLSSNIRLNRWFLTGSIGLGILIFGPGTTLGSLYFHETHQLEERSMSKMPPVPTEQRSNKGPGSDPKTEVDERVPGRENFDTQGRHGNIKQNTTNQGYQQDR